LPRMVNSDDMIVETPLRVFSWVDGMNEL